MLQYLHNAFAQAVTPGRFAALTPEEEAYFRGYGNGIARKLSGGAGDEYEVRAMEILQNAADEPTRTLGIGYRDGIAGAPLRDRRSGE